MESQNGYPVLDSLTDCKYYSIGDDGVRIPLEPGDAGWAIAYFARRFNNFVEPLDETDTHGYNKRRISGSTEWSNHASGTAADLNATKHAYGLVDTFSEEQVAKIRKIQDDFDGIIKWGGDYRNTKDEMHIEIDRSLEEVTLVVKRLKRYNKVRLSKLFRDKRNIDVYMVKRELRRKGYDSGSLSLFFGIGLTRALKKYQANNGLTVNGLADRETVEHLGFTAVP